MPNPFEVIFFDLGDTLMYDKEPWAPIMKQADIAMRRTLESAGYALADNAYGDFDTIFDLYYHRRQDTIQEETTVQLLRELMQRQDSSPPDHVLQDAMQAMYAITQQNWHLETDAIPSLQSLQDRGYRLGMISNAADDEDVQALIDMADLRRYFDFILSSAACGIRKPDPQIFQIALKHFDVRPEQTVMVGDTLDADILGANRMGMYSIWITRRAELSHEGELPIQPQAVIEFLKDLPVLLEELEDLHA